MDLFNTTDVSKANYRYITCTFQGLKIRIKGTKRSPPDNSHAISTICYLLFRRVYTCSLALLLSPVNVKYILSEWVYHGTWLIDKANRDVLSKLCVMEGSSSMHLISCIYSLLLKKLVPKLFSIVTTLNIFYIVEFKTVYKV